MIRLHFSDRAGAGRRGAAVVEAAVVLPILLLLTIGSIEFGRAMMVSNLLTTGASEGTRVGVLLNKNNDDINTAVIQRLNQSTISVSSNNIVISVNGDTTKDAATAVSGDLITVTVTVTYKDTSWLPTTWFIDGSSKMQGTATMRRE